MIKYPFLPKVNSTLLCIRTLKNTVGSKIYLLQMPRKDIKHLHIHYSFWSSYGYENWIKFSLLLSYCLRTFHLLGNNYDYYCCLVYSHRPMFIQNKLHLESAALCNSVVSCDAIHLCTYAWALKGHNWVLFAQMSQCTVTLTNSCTI